jgi:hypothetical protein
LLLASDFVGMSAILLWISRVVVVVVVMVEVFPKKDFEKRKFGEKYKENKLYSHKNAEKNLKTVFF